MQHYTQGSIRSAMRRLNIQLHYVLLMGALGILSYYSIGIFSKISPINHPLHLSGEVDSKFENVRKVFEQHFIDGLEPQGASLAVYVNDKKVVDLWGGYADFQANRIWQKDTIAVAFSTTKSVAAVCIALLADRGRLSYDDLVSKHWPGFAKNGKENITINWMVSHMAGLYYFETPVTKQMAKDHNLIREAIENEAPKITPGERSGYHALTYGWLVDQIIRHTDEKKRGIGQFFKEEIAQPNGIDFHIGLDIFSEEYRVARTALVQPVDLMKEIIHDYKSLYVLLSLLAGITFGPLKSAIGNPSWIILRTQCTVNDPEQHALEQAAVLGIGNARSLAKLFNLFMNGRIVSNETLRLLKNPIKNEEDFVLPMHVAVGHGFFYYPSIIGEDEFIVGHSGFGCQQVIFDSENKIVIAYIANGLKIGMYDSCRIYSNLQKAVYDALNIYCDGLHCYFAHLLRIWVSRYV
ncbi:unnamed protein product [Cylicocyclus nassatus]|uniref:Beta-lactamase-related domain-containing protein n=1 Tax=Cylicocyclus nassatus TaxID=53992 RepID=A0AA36H437_CYLNA|nr:unnamed protein product [Cylicocyclus nassatus]